MNQEAKDFTNYSDEDLITIIKSDGVDNSKEELEIITKILTERGYSFKYMEDLNENNDEDQQPNGKIERPSYYLPLRLLASIFFIGGLFLGLRSEFVGTGVLLMIASVIIKLGMSSYASRNEISE